MSPLPAVAPVLAVPAAAPVSAAASSGSAGGDFARLLAERSAAAQPGRATSTAPAAARPSPSPSPSPSVTPGVAPIAVTDPATKPPTPTPTPTPTPSTDGAAADAPAAPASTGEGAADAAATATVAAGKPLHARTGQRGTGTGGAALGAGTAAVAAQAVRANERAVSNSRLRATAHDVSIETQRQAQDGLQHDADPAAQAPAATEDLSAQALNLPFPPPPLPPLPAPTTEPAAVPATADVFGTTGPGTRVIGSFGPQSNARANAIPASAAPVPVPAAAATTDAAAISLPGSRTSMPAPKTDSMPTSYHATAAEPPVRPANASTTTTTTTSITSAPPTTTIPDAAVAALAQDAAALWQPPESDADAARPSISMPSGSLIRALPAPALPASGPTEPDRAASAHTLQAMAAAGLVVTPPSTERGDTRASDAAPAAPGIEPVTLAALPPWMAPAGFEPRAIETAQVPVVYVATPVDAPEFRDVLGVQISQLAGDGVHRAELSLNPAEMGPISVQIDMQGDQAQVVFGVDSAETRSLIEAGWAELASSLQEAGFTLSGGGVSQHAPDREAADESRSPVRGPRRAGTITSDAGAVAAAGVSLMPPPQPGAALDLYA